VENKTLLGGDNIMYSFAILLLAVMQPNLSNAVTVYIDDFFIIENNVTICYRINDGEAKLARGRDGNVITLPGTTVRLGWDRNNEWVKDCEPGTRVVWMY